MVKSFVVASTAGFCLGFRVSYGLKSAGENTFDFFGSRWTFAMSAMTADV